MAVQRAASGTAVQNRAMEVLPRTPAHVPGCLAVAASLPEWFGYPGALEGSPRH